MKTAGKLRCELRHHDYGEDVQVRFDFSPTAAPIGVVRNHIITNEQWSDFSDPNCTDDQYFDLLNVAESFGNDRPVTVCHDTETRRICGLQAPDGLGPLIILTEPVG